MNSTATIERTAVTDATDTLMGIAPLMTMAMHRVDMVPLGQTLLKRASGNPDAPCANALMDLSIVLQFFNNHEIAMSMQEQALRLQQLYRLPAKGKPAIRLLAVKGPGDVGANTPLEFLVEDSDIELHMLYLGPGLPFPKELPEHDVMFVAIGESEASLPLLKFLERVVHAWPAPVLNMPARIARLSRDSVSELLRSVQGVVMPASIRMNRQTLQRIGLGEEHAAFPIIIRPVDSHAGKGLIKAEDRATVSEYLQTRTETEFYIARFVDYRCEDGLFRKYRVVLIDGRPYASHMAISDHWMIHYLNGGMDESAGKRAEEERFMADFDRGLRSPAPRCTARYRRSYRTRLPGDRLCRDSEWRVAGLRSRQQRRCARHGFGRIVSL